MSQWVRASNWGGGKCCELKAEMVSSIVSNCEVGGEETEVEVVVGTVDGMIDAFSFFEIPRRGEDFEIRELEIETAIRNRGV
jgi:hypothetical protein